MANSSLPTSGGSGGNADTRTTGDGDHRQVVVLAGETDAEVAKFVNTTPDAGDYGLVVRPIASGTQPVSGTVAVSGTVPVSDAGSTLSVDDGGASLTVDGTVAVTGTFWQATQPVSAASLPLPTGAATEATLDARSGSLTESAPASDTASSGLNGRLQRIAQRLTSLIALFPTALTGSGNFKAAIVESTATLTANPEPSTAIYDGSVTGITTTAAAMPTQACREVVVIADPDNEANLLIGNATSQSNPLQPGQWAVIPCLNVNLVYRKAASGTVAASYMARN